MNGGSVKRSLVLMSLILVLLAVIVVGGVSILGIESMSKMANSDYEKAKVEGYDSEITFVTETTAADTFGLTIRITSL